MKQVINVLKRKDGEKRIAVLRLEVDYELATLFDAMRDNDEETKTKCIEKLEKLRQELISLEG